MCQGSFRRCWQTSDGPLEFEGNRLYEAMRADVFASDGPTVRSKDNRWCQAVRGPGPSLQAVSAAYEVRVELAGDVAFQGAHDLACGTTFGDPARDVFAGAFIATRAGEHDPPQGMVRSAVLTGVQAMTVDFPRRRPQECDATPMANAASLFSRLAVVPDDVADAVDGWASDGGVVSVMVVDVQPAGKGSCSLAVRAPCSDVCPFGEKRAVESLSFAVGGGPVGLSEAVRDLVERCGELAASVAAAVVRQDAFDGDVVRGEEGSRASPEVGGGRALLIGEDFGVCEAAVAVDRRVHERVADLGAMPSSSFVGAAVHTPAATFGDPTEFLDVDVHELAWAGHFHAPNRCSGHPVEMIESIEGVADEHPVDGRRRHVHDPRDPRRSKSTIPAQRDDAPLPRRLRLCR